MLLIGSMAAKLRGYLPAHRHGLCGDVDIFGTPEEMVSLIGHFPHGPFPPATSAESKWAAGKFNIAVGPHRIEFDTNSLPSVAMTYALGDNAPVKWLGVPMMAISAETMVIQKMCIRGILDKPKHEEDIAALRPMVSMTPAHLRLFRQLRREARTRFGCSQPRSTMLFPQHQEKEHP